MSNRYAPYKCRYLSREPKTLVCRFVSTGTSGEQTLVNGSTTTTGPFNQGITNVVESGTGLYTFNLTDKYRYFAGIDFVTSATDDRLDYVTNSTCNHDSTPVVAIQCSDSDAEATVIANTVTVNVRLHFVDSAD